MGIIENLANAIFSGVNLIISLVIEFINWIRAKTGDSTKESFSVKEEKEYSSYSWIALIVCAVPILTAVFYREGALFFIIAYYAVLIPVSIGVMVLSHNWPGFLTPDIKKLWINIREVRLLSLIDFITFSGLTLIIWVRFIGEEMTVNMLAPYILSLSTLSTGLLTLATFIKSKENRDYLLFYHNVDALLAKRSKNTAELEETIHNLEKTAFQAQKDGEPLILSQCLNRLTALYDRLFVQLAKKSKKFEIRKLRIQKNQILAALQRNSDKLQKKLKK